MAESKSLFFRTNIKLLRQRRKRTQDEVAFALSMKRTTLSGYENGVAEPSMEALLSFADYYKMSIDTLVRTDLTSLTERQLTELELGSDVYMRGSQLRVLTTQVDKDEKENIELVNEKAKAGYATGYADPDYIQQLPAFSLPFLHRERKYRTFQISGDSMLPIPSGAYITGEYVMDWQSIKSGSPCIILTESEGVVFKVVENNLKERRSLLLKSLNPLYSPYEMPAKEVKEVWRFVHYICTQMPDPALPPNEIINTLVRLQEDVDKLKRSNGVN